MADKEIMIGTHGPFLIDDADPLYTDTRQVATKGDIPTGVSHTITLAKLTTGGTNGSITILNGLIISHVDPT